ncbi:MAG: 5-bromo-4-chloroindolyl phosphate hydrolysis family protein [Clostridia bacterium]|nr:5-bromo-4-chloroindolyl phosphate hydrolysis family protein [Clostridia bacterium]
MADTKRTEKIIEKDGRKYREVPKKSALPFWAAAAVWVIAALFLPMYNMLHIAGIAIVSVGAALLTAKLLPRETELVEIPFYTGNTDLDSMVKTISEALVCFREAEAVLTEKGIDTAHRLDSIADTTEKIRDALIDEPRDLPVVRRFMNYYLPTTEKLVKKYVFVVKQDTESENITATKASIEGALAQIDTAFTHQLDALFADDALDISTDIAVLEALMVRDNLK